MNVKIKFLVLCGFLFLAAPTLSIASGFNFANDLRLGDHNTDVTELQKILNSSSDTVVVTSGYGSPGNETLYFGNLTKLAVIKFQEKYKSDILIPNGLTSGTGFVGPLTRIKLSQVSNSVGSKVIETIATTTTDTIRDEANSSSENITEGPNIDYISDVNIVSGGKLTIYGGGFLKSSVVFVDDIQVPVSNFIDQKTITVSIPYIADGPHFVYVKNAEGLDTRLATPVFVVVSKNIVLSKTTKADHSNATDVINVLNKLGIPNIINI